MKSKQVLSNENFYFGKIPNDWKWKTIDEIKDDGKSLVSGPFGSNIGKRFFRLMGVPVIRGNNLKQGKFVDSGFVFVDEEKANELKNCIALDDDIIFTAAGTIGQVGIIPKDGKYPKYIISNKQLRLRVNTSLTNPLFVFYWFSSKKMQQYLINSNVGSAVPLLTLRELKNMPIPIPPLSEQNQIIKILNDFYEKIQHLHKQNKILEQIIQSIFKSWFVDFDGVTEFEDSELGKIPKGWQVGTIGELAHITSGKRPDHVSANKNSEFNIPLYGASGIMGYVNDFLYEHRIMLTGRVGTIGKIQYVYGKCFPSDNTLIILPKESHYFNFLYSILLNNDFESIIVGSTQPLITQTNLKNILCVISKDKIIQFEIITMIFFDNFFKNKSIIKNLEDLRDSLLPKLMSGEIQV